MNTPAVPIGTSLPGGAVAGRVLWSDEQGCAIHAVKGGGRALLLEVAPYTPSSPPTGFERLSTRGTDFDLLMSPKGMRLEPVAKLPPPQDIDEANSFASALGRSDDLQRTTLLYAEKLGTIMSSGPTREASVDRAQILGRYLSGIDLRADDIVQLEKFTPWADRDALLGILENAGVQAMAVDHREAAQYRAKVCLTANEGEFVLHGRPELAAFFNEHVVDIIQNQERYARMGIGFPGGIILEGPTGTGKTYAVEQLAEHLGWPTFEIEASSVASPYIHETSRKVAQLFASAIEAAPSIIVIDEMEAFLADRDSGSGHHKIEEVAEFLRRIPEAAANRVLVIGMTNKIEMIDTAILRRGRFDHIVHVGPASLEDVRQLIEKQFATLPHDHLDFEAIAIRLTGRSLADAAYIGREAGRIAARKKRDTITASDVDRAVDSTLPRGEGRSTIGFGRGAA